MYLQRLLCWLAVTAAVSGPALAAIKPRFMLDYSSWHATNIVLVVTTPTVGTFEVMESWKGQLKAGTLLVIPELRPASNAVPISRYPRDWWSLTPGQEKIVEMVPRQPAGSQLVPLLIGGHLKQSKVRTGQSPMFGSPRTS
jgi:hypothetical protein